MDAASPGASDAEGVEFGVDAEDGDVFGECLRGDHAVEGVAVVAGKSARAEGMGCGDRKQSVAGALN